MGDKLSSLKETNVSTFSYFLNNDKAGYPNWAILLMMKQASWACFSEFPNPWVIVAKSLSTNLKELKQISFTLSDLSLR